MRTKIVLIGVIVWTLIPILTGFNLDTNFPHVYSDPEPDVNGKPQKSFFGYSVILQSKWLQIGAPRGNKLSENRGLIFRCPINSPCRKIVTPAKCPGIKGDWVGGAMDVQFVDKPGRTVACGHRWQADMDPRQTGTYIVPGVCYLMSESESNKTRCVNPHTVDKNKDRFVLKYRGVSVYDLALSQAGISVHIPHVHQKSKLLLGSPGVNNWAGNTFLLTIMETGLNRQEIGIDALYESGFGGFDYLGYQVNSGRFFSQTNILYVATAPRYKSLSGCAILMTLDSNPIIITIVQGIGFGEYFGASLAVGDFNNDGFDDLAVGAPLFSGLRGNEYDAGCIYMFYGKKDGKNLVIQQQNHQITTLVSGSRFGATVVSLGDMDHDGYHDIAVGAPYEDGSRGAVYIYNGKLSGLESKHSQRIMAKHVADGLLGFGISIARPVDVDNNSYTDLVIGSYLSGHAVLLRSHPVVKLDQFLSANQIKVKSDSKSFSIVACISYNGSHAPAQIRVNRTLIVDSTYRRAHWSNLNLATNRREDNIVINITNPHCENVSIILKQNMTSHEIQIPIEIRLYHQLAIDHKTRKHVVWINNTKTDTLSDKFCKTCPVVAQEQLNERTLNIPISIDCTDEICNSNLSLVCALREKTFVIGSSKNIELHLEVENKGEPAYETRVIVRIPFPVQLYKVPSGCEFTEDSDGILVDCYVDYKLNSGIKKNISLILDMTAVSSSSQQDAGFLNLYVNTTTDSTEIDKQDDSCIISVSVISEADMTIVGKAHSQTADTYKQENTANSSIEFVHDYEVQKFGDSPIERVLIEVMIPTDWLADNKTNNFLKIYKPEGSQSDQLLMCSSTINSETYLTNVVSEETDTLLREKRSNVKTSVVPTALQQLQANQTFILNCSTPNVKCSTVTCESRLFDSTSVARLRIRMTIDVSKIVPLLGTKHVIELHSQGRVTILVPSNFKQTHKFDDKPDEAIVKTRFIGSVPTQELAHWVIPVSIGGGHLLLFVLVMTLVKAGFFERNKKKELEILKTVDAEEKEAHRRTMMMDAENMDTDVDPSG